MAELPIVWQILVALLFSVVVILGLGMGLGGFLTWQERKQSAQMQDRIGPNRAPITIPLLGIKLYLFGLPHFVADGLKMLMKEDFIPENANKVLFWLAPAVALFATMVGFAVIPFGGVNEIAGYKINFQIATLNSGILFLFAFAGLSVYGGVLAGYSLDNKLGLIGSMRTAAQLVSYEVSLGLTLIGIFMIYQTLQLDVIAARQGETLFGFLPNWGVVWQPLGFLLFFAAAVAETKRAPFDMPEGESEIIGYFVEYSGMKFGAFMFAEFIEVVLAAALITTLFFGAYHIPWVQWEWITSWLQATVGTDWLPGLLTGLLQFGVFAAKVFFFCFLQLALRWTVVRFRYDQVMDFGWKLLLPLSLANIFITAIVMLIVL